MSEIYLAGGCFWGMEKYIASVNGVVLTQVGYANGMTANPTYEQVCRLSTGHAETVKIVYNSEIISLEFLLRLFFDAIDPTAINRQGMDIGTQYRSGIYYADERSGQIAMAAVGELSKLYNKPIAVEVKRLDNFYPAEDYHQKYLDKNPSGYCHISSEKFEKAAKAVVDPSRYNPPEKDKLKQTLKQIQYGVTQYGVTEMPFHNEFWDSHKSGIYVDVTTGEPLFVSDDKFESGCGWPSFSKPIDPNVLREESDSSHGMRRTEVKSRIGDAHLGHVFDDGPRELGGLRYCINSASLRFIPKCEMEKEGYGYLLELVK